MMASDWGELLDVCRYVGPAPVLLDDYRQMVAVQAVKNILVNPQSVE
jgi:hypothetical protein